MEPVTLPQTRRQAYPMNLRQAWRGNPQTGFSPGRASLWSTRGTLFFWVHLTDPRPWTLARQAEQLLCNWGDVMELFVQVDQNPDYYEFHVAPNGFILGLHWPEAKSFRGIAHEVDIQPYLIRPRLLRARVSRRKGSWTIGGSLPLSRLTKQRLRKSSLELRIQFARYDYLDDGTVVLSSTASLRRPSFHRRWEWGRFRVGPEKESPARRGNPEAVS